MYAEEEQSNSMKQTFETYRNTKAFEAIVHDTYQEAVPMENIPEAYTNAVKKMGLSPDEVKFYTAIRMDHFVEKAGNCVVLLRPNFFLYLTEEEQVSTIAVQLSRIKAGDLSEIPTENPDTQNLNTLNQASLVACAGALALYSRNAIMSALPHMRNFATSKAGMFVGLVGLANLVAYTHYKQKETDLLTKHELNVIDTMGPEELIKLRERQTHWIKLNNPWTYPIYQFLGKFPVYKSLGKLDLLEMPDAQLEKYLKHLKEKEAAK